MSRIARFLRSFPASLAVALAVLAPSAIAVLASRSPAFDAPDLDLTWPPRAEDPHEEMVRLFGRVERTQREIDEMLGRAREPARGGSSELAGLLKDSAARSHDVIEDIDRILELAGHTHPTGGT